MVDTDDTTHAGQRHGYGISSPQVKFDWVKYFFLNTDHLIEFFMQCINSTFQNAINNIFGFVVFNMD